MTRKKDSGAGPRPESADLQSRIDELEEKLEKQMQDTKFSRFCAGIIESIREPILVLDSRQHCLFANHSFYNAFKITPGQLDGQSVFALSGGILDIPCLRKRLTAKKRPVGNGHCEAVIDFDRTGHRTMLISTRNIEQEETDEGSVLVTFEDITARREAENIKLESEQKYRTMFESSRDAIMMLSPPDWLFTAGNPATVEMFRCRNEAEFTSMGPWELSPEIQPDGTPSALRAKKMIEIAMKEGKNFFEWTHRRADGEDFPATVLLSRIQLEGKTSLQATVRDITERKAAEEELIRHRHNLEDLVRERTEELMESEEKYRTLVEQSHDGIYIYSSDRFDFVNNSICDFMGYSREELYNMDFLELIHPEDRERIAGYRNRRFVGGDTPTFYQTRVVTRSGEVLDMEFSLRVISYKGERAVLGICRDISNLKKLEEERSKVQKLESLGILAGGIAHDFNNFLTGIMGNISLARMMIDPGSDIDGILSNSENAACKASGLTHQLLTFSRGGEPVKTQTFISNLLRESCNFVLSGSNVSADCNIPEDLWPVIADQGQISQVVHNIILNAVQAMPDGGVMNIVAENVLLDSSSSVPLPPGRYVSVDFTDNGIGIQSEILPRIFDPFFSTKDAGSGLGLATAYSILKKHNGYITAGSDEGKGSTFQVFIPAAVETIVIEETEELLSTACEGRILVMDDKEMIREISTAMLERLGYSVECAPDGREALDLYRIAMEENRPFDVVILDLTIPGGMGGRETMSKLLKIDPNVVAVVSSGYSTDPVMAEYRNYGFSGVMAKPYSFGTIASKVQQMIELRKRVSQD
jgi:PAS domain S-box-containing protein